MNIINVENITKVYTERELFSKASFYVQEREKIGIVGINGTGKSTLLKIVAGMEAPDEGSVIRANHVVINFLPQNPEFAAETGVLDSVMERIISTDMDEARRWTLESEAKALMYQLGIYDMN
jgi:ATP-binding cassette subfamily F protein uup